MLRLPPEMKRGTWSAAVRNNHRLRVECFSGSVLYLDLSHSSPAPDSTISPSTFMGSYNYLHFENEGNDVWSSQGSPKISSARSRCSHISIQSILNSKSGEMSFRCGDRALLGYNEMLRGRWGGASFIRFSGSHWHLAIAPRRYTGIFSSWENQKYWTVRFLADKTEL